MRHAPVLDLSAYFGIERVRDLGYVLECIDPPESLLCPAGDKPARPPVESTFRQRSECILMEGFGEGHRKEQSAFYLAAWS